MIWCTLGLLCCAASGLEMAALNGISSKVHLDFFIC